MFEPRVAPTRRRHTSRDISETIPYVVLGMRLGRNIRRKPLNAEQKASLLEVKKLLGGAVAMTFRLENPLKEDIAKRLSLGLAFDVGLVASAMGDLADEVRRSRSKEAVLAFEAARRAFTASRHLRKVLREVAIQACEHSKALEELAAVEPDEALSHYIANETYVDLPPRNFLISTVSITPVNGPNHVTEAHSSLGHVIRKAA